MDLKALLLEAKQKVPPVLQVLHCGDESMLVIGGDAGWKDPSPVGTVESPMEQVHAAPWWTGGLMGAPTVWGMEAGPISVLTIPPLVPYSHRRAWLRLLWGPGPSDHGLPQARSHADEAG